MRLRDDIELKEIIEKEKLYLFQEKRLELREKAKEAIAKIQLENRKTYNRKRKQASKYRIGELVAIKKTQITPGRKFCSKFLGPYEIIKILRGDRYVVAKIGEHEGPRTTSTSADHLKRWLMSEYASDNDSDNDCHDDTVFIASEADA
ncbi:hypothetical protein ALC62_11184 [Cyphomyrmex costatus]|uniref:Uncharacterized protein n=1 Tax=Cyphomyrmex costatus TaxID=456900 RepID=A0A151ICQ8_9HYME|nr:hypothetical protein ALC62_11184 [Cyphomyrmex costatus]